MTTSSAEDPYENMPTDAGFLEKLAADPTVPVATRRRASTMLAFLQSKPAPAKDWGAIRRRKRFGNRKSSGEVHGE